MIKTGIKEGIIMRRMISFTLYFLIIASHLSIQAVDEDEKSIDHETQDSLQMPLNSILSNTTRKRTHQEIANIKTYKIYNYHRDTKDKTIFIGNFHEDSHVLMLGHQGCLAM